MWSHLQWLQSAGPTRTMNVPLVHYYHALAAWKHIIWQASEKQVHVTIHLRVHEYAIKEELENSDPLTAASQTRAEVLYI